jgi:hypothetical protein
MYGSHREKENGMASEQAFFSRGSLNEELDWFRDLCKQQWPPEAFDMVETTLAELAQTGILKVALKADDDAPAFTLPDQEGRLVRSQELLAQGPLVLHFYRGMW